MNIHTSVKSLKTQSISTEYLQVVVQWEDELNEITERYQECLSRLTNSEVKNHINSELPVYWQTKDGREIPLSQLTDAHLRSILSLPYIHNNSKFKPLLSEYIKRFPQYKVLVGNQFILLTDVINQYGGWENLSEFKKYINQLMSY